MKHLDHCSQAQFTHQRVGHDTSQRRPQNRAPETEHAGADLIIGQLVGLSFDFGYDFHNAVLLPPHDTTVAPRVRQPSGKHRARDIRSAMRGNQLGYRSGRQQRHVTRQDQDVVVSEVVIRQNPESGR